MHWYIQSSGIVIDWEKPMLEAIQRKGLPWSPVGIVPFEETITGIEDVQEPCMFIGSTKLIEVVSEKEWKPGAIFDKEWFDPRACVGKRPDMLNDQMRTITVKQLREEWVQEVTFVKSVEVKVLTGMVLEPEVDDWLCWTEERADLDEDAVLVISLYRKLEKEWRFFIVDGEVVAGSTYRRDGYSCLTEPISDDTWKRVQGMAELWMPSDTIVMDVGLLRNGEFCVVEFNCINSSGVYKANTDRIVEALESKFREVG
jgi:hypothetical protein